MSDDEDDDEDEGMVAVAVHGRGHQKGVGIGASVGASVGIGAGVGVGASLGAGTGTNVRMRIKEIEVGTVLDHFVNELCPEDVDLSCELKQDFADDHWVNSRYANCEVMNVTQFIITLSLHTTSHK